MLIAAKTSALKASAIAALAALSVAALPAKPALAWGDKEQNFLAGVVTAVIVGEIIDANKKAKRAAPAPAPSPYPVYADPTPSYGTSIHATPAARAFASYSKEERKAIQRQLRRQGYYGGGIDGAFGPATYRAVTAYAQDRGASGHLKTTGGAFAVYDGLLY